MPASPRGFPVSASVIFSSSLEALASGSDSTSGIPLSPPSRKRTSIGIWPSSGTSAPAASGWGAALVRYELLMLAELGFGLDLDQCAVSGDHDDLVAVSPRSGRAVSAAEAEPYRGKLLPLPRFVREGGTAGWPDIVDGLALTGHFLLRDVISDRSTPVAESRHRLVERLHRAAGLA